MPTRLSGIQQPVQGANQPVSGGFSRHPDCYEPVSVAVRSGVDPEERSLSRRPPPDDVGETHSLGPDCRCCVQLGSPQFTQR